MKKVILRSKKDIKKTFKVVPGENENVEPGTYTVDFLLEILVNQMDLPADREIYEEDFKPFLKKIEIEFGKYKGNSIDEVYEQDKGYIAWLRDLNK